MLGGVLASCKETALTGTSLLSVPTVLKLVGLGGEGDTLLAKETWPAIAKGQENPILALALVMTVLS